MKYELRYFAQLYVAFEVFSKCPYWILPSSTSCILLGDYEAKLEFQQLKEEYRKLEFERDKL
jgi:hypothetical protein